LSKKRPKNDPRLALPLRLAPGRVVGAICVEQLREVARAAHSNARLHGVWRRMLADMLNGLDLFSGIGGLTLALAEWVRPIAYCENDRYAQGVLLSRMREGAIPISPIWDDVRSLRGRDLPPTDIVSGASLARTSLLRAVESAWTASEADFIGNSTDSLEKSNLDLYFSKTSQQLELAGLTSSRSHLPSSGMICAGRLYRPLKLAPSTFVNDGSYLPTPTSCDYGKNNGRNSPQARDRWSLTVLARRGQLPGHPAGRLNPEWIEQAMAYPIGWSAIADWAMPLSRSRRKQRSSDCSGLETK
jgi:hypothetical protein